MSWFDSFKNSTLAMPLTAGATRKQSFTGDIAWFCIASAFALGFGIVGDQMLRQSPLGLHYRTGADRILATPSLTVEEPAPIRVVGIEEVEILIADPKVITLDARPRVFYEMGRLPCARSLPREELEKGFPALEETLRAPGRTVLIYCSDASCEDGALVARSLEQRGIGSVQLFHGGFAEWEASGKPVETSR